MTEKDSRNPEKFELQGEAQIAAMLERIQPHPSADFHTRMETAPWMKQPKDMAFGDIGDRFSKIFEFIRTPRLRVLASATLLVLVVLSVTLATPSLRAVAQQIMHFFAPAESDRLDIQVTVPHPDDPNAFHSQAYYSLSVPQAEEMAGYPVKIISYLPGGFRFTGAHYNPTLRSVTLRYDSEGHSLLLTQRPLGEIVEYSSIGASAPIDTVQLRGVQGEFVAGGWRFTSTGDSVLSTAAPGTQVNLGVYWDHTLPQRILRWQEGTMQYEILSSRSGKGIALKKDDLIEIAERVK